MEVYHFLADSVIERSQSELLKASTQSQIHTFGWPIGIVLEADEFRPRPTNDGILVSFSAPLRSARGGSIFEYWALRRDGDFYALMSLFEDDLERTAEGTVLYFDTRIVRATELLLHCANLYKLLGAAPGALVELSVHYRGLKGRNLAAASNRHVGPHRNVVEGAISIPPINFRLGSLDTQLVDLAKKLCEPLFMLFDYATFDDTIYREIVGDFLNGKV